MLIDSATEQTTAATDLIITVLAVIALPIYGVMARPACADGSGAAYY